jgi:hypothetical protein
MLTRMGEARDWGTGLPLKSSLLGKMSRLEVHHIFPKAQLYKLKHNRPDVNALANFCFLTKDTKLNISDRLPEEYFPEIEAKHPGALASQWVPTDPALWKFERYLDFLEARNALLAAEANRRFEELLHGETRWMGTPAPVTDEVTATTGGAADEVEEAELESLNDWVESQGLPRGQIRFDYAGPATGSQKALFDLAWPGGLQAGLSAPVAVLLNESADVLTIASGAGYRCFTTSAGFRAYIKNDILRLQAA